VTVVGFTVQVSTVVEWYINSMVVTSFSLPRFPNPFHHPSARHDTPLERAGEFSLF
jgi:hypothetical protein